MPANRDIVSTLVAPAIFVLFWASGFIGARMGLPYAEPLTFLALRMIAVVALLACIIVATRPRWPGARAAAHSAVTGLLVHGAYLGGVFIAIGDGLPAGITALVVSLQPLLMVTLANRWLGERVVRRQWLGLLIGLAGVALVVGDRTAGSAGLLGWTASVVALLSITSGTIYQKRFGGGIDWRTAFFIQYASAGALFVAGALAFESMTVRWSGAFVFALGWLVLVLSLGTVWLLYFLIKRSAAARVASLFYLTPPITALIAFTLFGEKLPALALVGMTLCVAGVFLVNWRVARQQPS